MLCYWYKFTYLNECVYFAYKGSRIGFILLCTKLIWTVNSILVNYVRAQFNLFLHLVLLIFCTSKLYQLQNKTFSNIAIFLFSKLTTNFKSHLKYRTRSSALNIRYRGMTIAVYIFACLLFSACRLQGMNVFIWRIRWTDLLHLLSQLALLVKKDALIFTLKKVHCTVIKVRPTVLVVFHLEQEHSLIGLGWFPYEQDMTRPASESSPILSTLTSAFSRKADTNKLYSIKNMYKRLVNKLHTKCLFEWRWNLDLNYHLVSWRIA